MKRRHLFLIALVAALGVLAFGATDAFATFVKFDHKTGVMTYYESDIDVDGLANDVRVHKDPLVAGFYMIDDLGTSKGASVAQWADGSDLTKYCYAHTYHGPQPFFYENSCPATKIVVKLESGDDKITVDSDVKISTELQGGAGNDSISGGGGPDLIRGGCTQADPNYPCSGYFDVLMGNSGYDEIHGGPGWDVIHGGLNDDTVDGGPGDDSVHGDDGNDLVGGGPGKDEIYGDNGDRDLADYSSSTYPVSASLDGNANDGSSLDGGQHDTIEPDIEGIQGGPFGDVLTGNDFNNILKGGDGADKLMGQGGNDLLMGQGGNDDLRPGLGTDNLYGGGEIDTADYFDRTNPVSLSIDGPVSPGIDGIANDGEAGENDNIAFDVENLRGGSNNDTLIGYTNGNTLDGGYGDDKLYGNGAVWNGPTDTLLGGDGTDVLDGGPAGNYAWDTLDGGNGTDLVSYASRTGGVHIFLDGDFANSEDHISNVENAKGGSGDDLIVGNGGWNNLFGYGGNDWFDGKGGNDVLSGGIGNDTLQGGAGHDVLSAGDGADWMDGGANDDFISGHEGIDTVSYDDYAKGVNVSLDNQYNDGQSSGAEGDNVLDDTENVIGSYYGDRITGSALDNKLVGGLGPDTLIGGGGADTLDGGANTDSLDGGDGPDTLIGGTEDDKLFGRAGYDTQRGGPGNDALDGGGDPDIADYSTSATSVTINLAKATATGEGTDSFTSIEGAYGSPFNDTLMGDGNPNTLSGFEGNDTITGGGGNDHLFGAVGNDSIDGQLGDDELSGGLGTDTVSYADAPAGVTVDMSTYAANATGGAGNDWLSSTENVTGSPFADSITGSSATNLLLGGGGNDSLFGLGGDDSLDGQANADSVDGGVNVDSCLGETKTNCEK